MRFSLRKLFKKPKDTSSYIHSGFRVDPLPKQEDYGRLFGINDFYEVKPSQETIKRALERAWQNRDFEIEMYWKRAAYFWTFIGAAFVGYVAIVTSEKLKGNFYQLEFFMICLGFLFTLIWVLVNRGSKFWQENWEYHIDMLENTITGPLYKTTKIHPQYSVSKLNSLLNIYILCVWFLLGMYYVIHNELYYFVSGDPDLISWLIFVLTFFFSLLALRGRTRIHDKELTGFSLRTRLANNYLKEDKNNEKTKH